MDLSKFHIITSLTNPVRFKSRYRLYDNWLHHMRQAGIEPWTVEVAFGDRHFHTCKSNPRNLHLRSHNELWLKENALNLLVQRLPSDWEYVAWIDADVDFLYPGWLEQAWHQLQHYHVIQMWETAIDMKHHGAVMQTHASFAHCYQNDVIHNGKYGKYGHPGYGWAYSRDAWNGMGGLPDFAILGAGDHHAAVCLVGRGGESVPCGLNPKYKERVLAWQSHALATIKKDIGYLPTTIRHHWHGKKVDRKYWDRWQILIKNKFDPDYDLKRDHHGLWQLTDRNLKLRDDIRKYFRQRNEDSIDSE